MTTGTAGGTVSRVRGRVGRPATPIDWSAGRPSPAERSRLRTTVGADLREARLTAGLSTRGLARATGCARSTITRIERGERRPSEGLLRAVAAALNPDRPKQLADRLCAAAGASLRPDSPGVARQRLRRAQDAILAGHRALPRKIARVIELHGQADAARHRAMQLLDDPDALDEAAHLFEESRRLRDLAGPAVIVRIGRHEIRAGWSA